MHGGVGLSEGPDSIDCAMNNDTPSRTGESHGFDPNHLTTSVIALPLLAQMENERKIGNKLPKPGKETTGFLIYRTNGDEPLTLRQKNQLREQAREMAKELTPPESGTERGRTSHIIGEATCAA